MAFSVVLFGLSRVAMGEGVEVAEDGQGLPGKGDDVLLAHLHLVRRDVPLCRVEVHLGPLSMP